MNRKVVTGMRLSVYLAGYLPTCSWRWLSSFWSLELNQSVVQARRSQIEIVQQSQ
jgi:hypothetical protein